jgi:hypothetical protein
MLLNYRARNVSTKRPISLVQTIYCPGFTIGGSVEPLSIVATLLSLFMTRAGEPAFWLTLIALAALLVTHAIFWIVTQAVNKLW